jgi:hypothetical protein
MEQAIAQMKLNEGTKVSTDLKTILSIVAGVAIGVWGIFWPA